MQSIQNSPNNLEKEQRSLRTHISDLKTGCTGMVLRIVIYWHKYRNNLSHFGQLIFDKGATQFNRERVLFQQMALGTTNQIFTCKRMTLDSYLTSYTIINSQWIIDLNERVKTFKTLRRRYRRKYLWPWVRRCFLRHDTKSISDKRKKKKKPRYIGPHQNEKKIVLQTISPRK